jgi:division protein CdvB (Snf7/Vps24/ESCRT-III family)
MPEKFTENWQKKEKSSASGRLREQVAPPPPMKERLETAKRKLSEEITQLNRINDKLNQKDKTLYGQVVKAYEEHDNARAQSLASELAELRKVESRTQYGKYALERAYTKIEVAKDYGDMVAAMVPVGQIVKNVKSALVDFLPSTSNALGEIDAIMSDTLVSFSGLTNETQVLGPTSEDAEKILSEAAIIAESKLKEKLPGSDVGEQLRM